MIVQHGVRIAVMMLVFTPSQAMANQPPGPQVILSEVLILPLMIIFSLLGGAYGILATRRRAKPRRLRGLRPALAVLAILLSGIHEGLASLGALLFGLLAVKRGGQMILWGYIGRSSHERPEHLTKANPWRLIPSGVLLVVGTVFLMGMALAFVGYWPMIGQTTREKSLKDLLSYQLAYAQRQKFRTGKAEFHRIAPKDPEYDLYLRPLVDTYRGHWTFRVEYGGNAESFTAHLLPTSFPIFPYNYLTSQPSYRADETGKIRVMWVHKRDMMCPPDAPVVMQVTAQDLSEILNRLEKTP